MLESKGCYKHIEQDTWEHGCIDSPYNNSHFIDYFIQGETLEEIKHRIKSFCCCEDSSIQVNACEPGRIDIQIIEDSGGEIPAENQLQEWKEGKEILFLVTYSFQFEEVTRKPANF